MMYNFGFDLKRTLVAVSQLHTYVYHQILFNKEFNWTFHFTFKTFSVTDLSQKVARRRKSLNRQMTCDAMETKDRLTDVASLD